MGVGSCLVHDSGLRSRLRSVVGSHLVLCVVRADTAVGGTCFKNGRLIGLWCGAADVFMKNAGNQALIGQSFFGGSAFQHLKIGRRYPDIDPGVLACVPPCSLHGFFFAHALVFDRLERAAFVLSDQPFLFFSLTEFSSS